MKESHMRTKLAHTGDLELAKKIQSSVSVPKVLPIYMSSVFTFDDVPSLDAVYAGEADGYVYSRMTNPSTDAAEEMLAAAEGADGALVFSSGMAAIILPMCRPATTSFPRQSYMAAYMIILSMNCPALAWRSPLWSLMTQPRWRLLSAPIPRWSTLRPSAIP